MTTRRGFWWRSTPGVPCAPALAPVLAGLLALAACGDTSEDRPRPRPGTGDTAGGDAPAGDPSGGDQAGPGGDELAGGDEGPPTSCSAEPGALIVTEYLPAPLAGAVEWIEVYNPAPQARALDQLMLVVSDGGGYSASLQIDGGGSPLLVAPLAYAVLAAGPAVFATWDWGQALALPDAAATPGSGSGASIRLLCGAVVVDQVAYDGDNQPPAPAAGASLAFDGSLTPHHILNDDARRWCAGASLYDGDNRGTPGAPNDSCSGGLCHDGAGNRPIVAPAPGQLLFSEVFANPAGADGDGASEWLELYNLGASAADLYGLSLRNTNASSSRAFGLAAPGGANPDACLTVPAHGYALLAGAASGNGGLPPVTAVLLGESLYNSTAPLAVALYDGPTLIDSAPYPTPSEGVAWSLSAPAVVAGSNDALSDWCAAQVSGQFGGLGTPGAANPECGLRYCQDGASLRPARPPAPGELIVTEIFADPTGLAATEFPAEWLEVFVAASSAPDLAGLQVRSRTASNQRSFSLQASGCASATPGSFLVLAGSVEPATNGGLPLVDWPLAGSSAGFYQPADATSLELWLDGLRLDMAPYRSGRENHSYSLDPTRLDGSSNDLTASWCEGTSAGVFNGFGTPGAPNPPCS